MTPLQAMSVNLMGSDFQNSECETVLRAVIIIQKRKNPDQWEPFTWEQFCERCDHNPSSDEKQVLDALVNGGKPVWNTSCYLQPGWFTFENGAYMIGERTIQMLERMASR